MASFTAKGPALPNMVASSSLGRLESARRLLARRPLSWSPGTALAQPPVVHGPCQATVRPPAGPATIMCSSLRKERKKLAKVLKSHRKVLEKRLAALSVTEVDSPVLSDLLTELRILRSQLESQRPIAAYDSDSSDSDDECTARPLGSIAASCSRRQQLLQQTTAALPATAPSTTTTTIPTDSDNDLSSSMIISGLSGQVEVAVPEPQEGWDWDEEAFRATQFPGAGGRIMVCTGSKCQRKGATEVLRAVSALSEGNPAIEVVPCKCVGKCSAGAALRVRPQGQACATYTQVRPGQLREMFEEHFGEAPVAPVAQPMAQPMMAGHVSASANVGSTEVLACCHDAPAASALAPVVACCAECMEA